MLSVEQSHKVRFISKFGLLEVHILAIVVIVVAVNVSINTIAKNLVVGSSVLASDSHSQCNHNIYDCKAFFVFAIVACCLPLHSL